MKAWVVFESNNPHINELGEIFVFSTREAAEKFVQDSPRASVMEADVDAGTAARFVDEVDNDD